LLSEPMEDQLGNILANISENEAGFFQTSRIIWDPPDPFFLDEFPASVFSHGKLFGYEEILKGFSTMTLKLKKKRKEKKVPLDYPLVYKDVKEKSQFELLINRYRWLRTNSSVSNESFRSNTLSESYQYLSTLFLSNETLFNQITKTLLRKGWLFPDEMKMELAERFPIP